MAIVGIRDLNRNTKGVIEKLEETREPVILTRQGQPIATILPVDQSRLNELVISTAPEFVDSMRSAEEQFEAGETRPLGEVMAEIRAKRAAAEEAEEPEHSVPAVQSSSTEAETVADVALPLAKLVGAYSMGGAAFQAAAVERAHRLSEAIVEEATEHEVLSREGEEAEPMKTINEVNTRLYGIAFMAERFRAIDAAMQEMAESKQVKGKELVTDEDPDDSGRPESIDIADLASAYVWNINRYLLAHSKRRGGVSIGEYARSLRQTSEALEAADEPVTADSVFVTNA